MTPAVVLEGHSDCRNHIKTGREQEKAYSQFSLLLLSDLLSVLPTGRIHLDTRDKGLVIKVIKFKDKYPYRRRRQKEN